MATVELDPAADPRISAAIRKLVSDLCDSVRDDAELIAPIRTGELRASLKAKMVDDRTGRVGSDKVYAAPVELGYHLVAWGHRTGRFIPAQPYLRPALFRYRASL